MTATLFKQTFLISSSSETTMPCSSSESPRTGFIWRFNHSQIIVNDGTVMKEWRQQVKSVSESGDLTLKDLPVDYEGLYTCEISNAEGTNVTNTYLRIEKSQVSALTGGQTAGIVFGVGVGVALVILAAVAVVLYIKREKKPKAEGDNQAEGDSPTVRYSPVNVSEPAAGDEH
ncbi:hypothetical protein PBY51_014096 [Eleginops maclovinus]|uniref:Ig-like domain-containing protein n=1 Tax=Eleginops maclovinus TaxID=56733 RepID=A0AAN7WZ08_ELEMC|nr:hypothetical protein PBY51_014096 [Eleginops maclovinus]